MKCLNAFETLIRKEIYIYELRVNDRTRGEEVCVLYIVLLMRTMRRRKWRKELEYLEPRSVVGFYLKNPCASSMVPPFERLI